MQNNTILENKLSELRKQYKTASDEDKPRILNNANRIKTALAWQLPVHIANFSDGSKLSDWQNLDDNITQSLL